MIYLYFNFYRSLKVIRIGLFLRLMRIMLIPTTMMTRNRLYRTRIDSVHILHITLKPFSFSSWEQSLSVQTECLQTLNYDTHFTSMLHHCSFLSVVLLTGDGSRPVYSRVTTASRRATYSQSCQNGTLIWAFPLTNKTVFFSGKLNFIFLGYPSRWMITRKTGL